MVPFSNTPKENNITPKVFFNTPFLFSDKASLIPDKARLFEKNRSLLTSRLIQKKAAKPFSLAAF